MFNLWCEMTAVCHSDTLSMPQATRFNRFCFNRTSCVCHVWSLALPRI